MGLFAFIPSYKPQREDSRFRSTEILYDDGLNKMWRTHWDLVSIPPANDDQFYTVQEGENNRIDLVAWRYYNNVRLWWVIALANNLYCPLFIRSGTVLRVPSLSRVYTSIIKR